MMPTHYTEREERIDPRRLHRINPTDLAKVDAMVTDLRSGATMPPVLVSRHVNMMFLHDGNHRAAAHAILGLPIRCIVRTNSDRTMDYPTHKPKEAHENA